MIFQNLLIGCLRAAGQIDCADRKAFLRIGYNIKARGYVLYPGKVMQADTFRVGNIGEIYAEDIEKLAAIMADFLKEAGKWAS